MISLVAWGHAGNEIHPAAKKAQLEGNEQAKEKANKNLEPLRLVSQVLTAADMKSVEGYASSWTLLARANPGIAATSPTQSRRIPRADAAGDRSLSG